MISACSENVAPVNYVILKGKLTYPQLKREVTLSVKDSKDNINLIADNDGVFLDTLWLEKPSYFTGLYFKPFGLYLKSGMELQLTFTDTLSMPAFSGKGSAENIILNTKNKRYEDLIGSYPFTRFLSLPRADYDQEVDQYVADINSMIRANKEVLDDDFITKYLQNADTIKSSMEPLYQRQQQMIRELSPGTPSPDFKDYVNYTGGTTSLQDLRGKYVYIDIWATWCKPCKYEIPYLEKIENFYEDSNIEFVSISIDRKEEEQAWRSMIEEKKMGGIQLWAGKNKDIEFVDKYYVQGIPRFILLDPDGKIIEYDAPRPSDPKLKEILDRLL
ncbi:TlpA family protein disulfide reductase [Robertkochia solimangrovi]|nr:TlpA family protein disulfide reductase [Robertkochia solimangrovi]